MARARGPWIGQTGLRLALVFAGVAVLSIGTVLAIAAATVAGDLNRLVTEQRTDITHALALASHDAYGRAGWNRGDLSPVLDLVDRAGAAVQVRGHGGRVISATPGFARSSWTSERREAVTVRGRPVGSVTVKFDNTGLEAAVAQFADLRWHIRLAGAAAALLVALVVSVVVSKCITVPVDRLTRAARAMEAGDGSARVGKTRGVAEVRELAVAFDQMAESLAGQAQLRRDTLADIAHELRTPIAVLQAESEAMADGVIDPSDASLGSLREQAGRLARTVDDLQALAEAAALQVELAPHDLGVIAAQAADGLARSFAEADVRLVRRLGRIQVRCDGHRMHEVAVNLLSNAVKYTPAGGTVTIETSPIETSPIETSPIETSPIATSSIATSPAGQPGKLAVLRVTDTGVGIPAADLPHVSERFFRGRAVSAVPGSGLGLAIVAELVSAQRGRLDIASEPGAGTKVTVTLPAGAAGDPDDPGGRDGGAGAGSG